MFGGGRKKAEQQQREQARQSKVAESQRALIEAAVSTAHIAQDVTRTMKRKMEDAINQFESTARIINDAFLICDEQGSIQASNPSAQRMFGHADPKNLLELFTRSTGAVIPDMGDFWTATKGRRRALKGKHADGSMFPVSITLTALDRSDGSRVVLMVIQDLTFLNKTFDNAKDGFVVTMRTGEIVAANAAVRRVYGYSAEDLMGKDVSTIMCSKDRSGNLLTVFFEVARIQWDGEEAVLITIRDV